MRWIIVLLSLICSASSHAVIFDESSKVDWGYVGNKGPTHWAGLNPGFSMCAKGKRQSPIDIPKQVGTADNELKLKYRLAKAWAVDDGTTELYIGNDHTVIRDGHGIQVNFHKDEAAEEVEYKGETYRLVQFHLHTPSENHWHSRSYPMEVHFVHQGEGGKLLVIGVFVKAGIANPVLSRLVQQLPAERDKEYVLDKPISPRDLMPVKLKGYYEFAGSLTTPPCLEGVQWIVMADSITASTAQIASLREAMGGSNARPIQPLHKRRIFYVRLNK